MATCDSISELGINYLVVLFIWVGLFIGTMLRHGNPSDSHSVAGGEGKLLNKKAIFGETGKRREGGGGKGRGGGGERGRRGGGGRGGGGGCGNDDNFLKKKRK